MVLCAEAQGFFAGTQTSVAVEEPAGISAAIPDHPAK